MSDKDLLAVIAEMLRKQDQQAGKLDRHEKILNETNENLKQLVDISIKQFQEQDLFNNKFNAEFEIQKQFNGEQKKFNTEQKQFDEDQRRFNENQKQFNEDQIKFNTEQKQFNEDQRRFNEGQARFNEDQIKFNTEQKQFNEDQRRFNEGQARFNERLMNKLDDIEQALKNK